MSQINISLDTSTGKVSCVIDGKEYNTTDISIYSYDQGESDEKAHFEFYARLKSEKEQDLSINTSISTYANAKGNVVKQLSKDLVITQSPDIDGFLKNKKHYLY